MKHTQAEVRERAGQIVVDQLKLDPAQVKWELSFQELGADSLDLIELIIKFEDTFKIMITDEEADRLKNLEDLITFLS